VANVRPRSFAGFARTGGGGDVFLFETAGDWVKAEQMIADLREEFRASIAEH
jgi:hypothetical protein